MQSQLTEMRVAVSVLIVTLWLSPGSGAGAQSPPSAAELARKLQAHYSTVKDFTADFSHSYRGVIPRQTPVERGKVQIKKPGHMRWTYVSPEKKELVADGSQIYWYVAADKQVTVTAMPKPEEASAAVLFLAGRGDLARDFTPSLPAEQSPTAWRLMLVPKSPQADFTSLTLVIDPATLKLVGLSTIDPQGSTSTFEFSNLRENVGLSDREFVFTFPRGVDVIRQTAND